MSNISGFKKYRYKLFKFVHYHLHLFNRKSDKWLIEHLFKCEMGYPLNLKNPQGFNEKLQWLKLNYHQEIYSTLADKYLVREYIELNVPELNLIPLLGKYENANDIDFDKLPNQFVLKCNHTSGRGLFVVKDKSRLSKKEIKHIKKGLNKALKYNFYYETRELPYKSMKPLILCEEYMTDNEKVDYITDYKFYCFDGYVDCVMVCLERETGHPKFYFFDKKWELKRINIAGKNAPANFSVPKPSQMDKMFEIAEKLSKGFPYLRMDLYQINDKIYFGEYTFYPKGGFDPNYLEETEKYFGNLIELPNKEK